MNLSELKNFIIQTLEKKKALNIEEISISDKSTLADYFIISSGTSSTQVKSLAENIKYEINKKFGLNPKRVEGFSSGNWILIDYQDIVVHIFLEETRSTYSLEDLWK